MGRAIRVTPTKEVKAPNCSRRVKGSLIRMLQAKQLMQGEMKVITVASARGR